MRNQYVTANENVVFQKKFFYKFHDEHVRGLMFWNYGHAMWVYVFNYARNMFPYSVGL